MKQSIMNTAMVILLVVGAYLLGTYKTKVEYLEKGVGLGAGVPTAQAPAVEEKTVLSDDEWNKVLENPVYAKGEEGAKVTIVEFTDFQCPFCKRYVDETYDLILKNYVETGKARYLYRDLPLDFHVNAEAAAVAARCSVAGGKFDAMHAELFANQDAWGALPDPTETFVGYAVKVGLAQDSFRTCLGSAEIKSAVQADLALANQVGATGTPTFIINGQVLVGAQPYSSFEALIESQL